MVGFNRRYSPHGRQAREFFAGRREPLVMAYRVNAGAIPREHWVQDPESGGGRIIGEGCHFIDYMQFVCGAPVTSVRGQAIARHSSGITEDQCVLTFTFADGSVGTLIYAAGGDKALAKERFEAFGAGKSLVMDDFLVTEFYDGGARRRFRTEQARQGLCCRDGTVLQRSGAGRGCLHVVRGHRGGQPRVHPRRAQPADRGGVRGVKPASTPGFTRRSRRPLRRGHRADCGWYLQRLSVMSPAEMLHRAGEQWVLRRLRSQHRRRSPALPANLGLLPGHAGATARAALG